MSGAAVNLRSLAGGADTVTPVAGVDGLLLMFPASEVQIGTEPPVLPDLVTSANGGDGIAWARGVRAGWTISGASDTARRGRWNVGWTGINASERAALEAWLASLGQTRDGWPLRPDGPGTASVNVRFVRPPTMTRLDAGGAAGSGVSRIDASECEEVL